MGMSPNQRRDPCEYETTGAHTRSPAKTYKDKKQKWGIEKQAYVHKT